MVRSRRYEKWSPDSSVHTGDCSRSRTPRRSSCACTPAVTSTAGVPQLVSAYASRLDGGDLGAHRVRHFIAAAADGGACAGDDPARLRAEFDHRRDGGGHDSGDHAGPSRVSGGDDSGDGVGEQDRRAVGGEDGEGEAAASGDDGVDLRHGTVSPGFVDHGHVPPVHLVHPDDPGRVEAERLGSQFAIGAYGVGVVADLPHSRLRSSEGTPTAEVELLVRNGAHPAPPVGEGEMRAAHCARFGAMSYHLRKSGTSSSSAALSE